MQSFSIEIQGTVCRVRMPKTMSASAAETFRETHLQLRNQYSNIDQIVLDFDDTFFLDSMGLGALVSLYKDAQSNAVNLLLSQVSSQVMLVLSMTGLEEVFTVTTA